MYGTATTRRQVAMSYGICPRTLNKWLKAENISLPKGLISPKQLEDIVNRFGKPAKSFS